jgi:hypothetical protein
MVPRFAGSSAASSGDRIAVRRGRSHVGRAVENTKYQEQRGFSVCYPDPSCAPGSPRRTAAVGQTLRAAPESHAKKRKNSHVFVADLPTGAGPPAAFFGLLKARDDVTVRFDLRVRQDPKRIVAAS